MEQAITRMVELMVSRMKELAKVSELAVTRMAELPGNELTLKRCNWCGYC